MLKLERNYRSTQPILDVANWLLARSPLGFDRKLVADRGGSSTRPLLVELSSPHEEADWIANDLTERHENGSVWRGLMVLLRTAFSERELEGVLIERDIPYVSSVRFAKWNSKNDLIISMDYAQKRVSTI